MRRPANIIRLRLEVSPLGVALRFALLATVVSLSVSIIASATDWQDAAPANTPPATSNPPTLPAASDQRSEPSGSAPLRVMVGKSLLVNTTERLKRVSVTDP